MYFPLLATVAQRKVELLHKVFPSQRARDWWMMKSSWDWHGYAA